jgi:hypothetical protein
MTKYQVGSGSSTQDEAILLFVTGATNLYHSLDPSSLRLYWLELQQCVVLFNSKCDDLFPMRSSYYLLQLQQCYYLFQMQFSFYLLQMQTEAIFQYWLLM